MTSNVELPPLPEWVPDPIIGHLLIDVDREFCEQYATNYAIACTEALRTEVESLRTDVEVLVRMRQAQEDRADRLAEALREIERRVPKDRAGPSWIARTIAAEALHPTAAQEHDNVEAHTTVGRDTPR